MPQRPTPDFRRRRSPRRFAAAAVLAAAAFAAGSSAAGVCHAESGTQRNTLVELYTSEGCNSCPPADRWLSTLHAAPGIVPLAFHVDYWDHLGWRDRFAAAGFTQRQRERVRTAGAGFVYTPQVIADGRDFAAWRRPGSAAWLHPAGTAGASIALDAEPATADAIRVHLTARLNTGTAMPAVAWLALYENALSSSVRAGENAGERLNHDFVVRQWIGPLAFDGEGRIDLTRTLPRREVVVERSGVAAIVERPGDGSVLQALRLALCDR